MQFRNEKQEVDLDDELGETLSDLQRHPPIALEVKIKSTQWYLSYCMLLSVVLS